VEVCRAANAAASVITLNSLPAKHRGTAGAKYFANQHQIATRIPGFLPKFMMFLWPIRCDMAG
jgi:hypothetical protein